MEGRGHVLFGGGFFKSDGFPELLDRVPARERHRVAEAAFLYRGSVIGLACFLIDLDCRGDLWTLEDGPTALCIEFRKVGQSLAEFLERITKWLRDIFLIKDSDDLALIMKDDLVHLFKPIFFIILNLLNLA